MTYGCRMFEKISADHAAATCKKYTHDDAINLPLTIRIGGQSFVVIEGIESVAFNKFIPLS